MKGDGDTLTLDRLLELLVALFTILGPLLGMIIYAENKFSTLDRKLERMDSTIVCVVNASTYNYDASHCIRNR